MAFIVDGKIHILDDESNEIIKIHEETSFNSVGWVSGCNYDYYVATDNSGNIWLKYKSENFSLISLEVDITFLSISCGQDFMITLNSEGYLWYGDKYDLTCLSQDVRKAEDLNRGPRFVFACCDEYITAIDDQGDLWSSCPIISKESYQNWDVTEFGCNHYIHNLSKRSDFTDVKFTSCSSDGSKIFALDENGKVWVYTECCYKTYPERDVTKLNRLLCDEMFVMLSGPIGLDVNGFLWWVGYKGHIHPQEPYTPTKFDDPNHKDVTFIDIAYFSDGFFALDSNNYLWKYTSSTGLNQIANVNIEKMINEPIRARKINIKSAAMAI